MSKTMLYLVQVIDICQKGIAMPRPKRCRKICKYPNIWSFSPDESGNSETIVFMLDEFETIRLIDYEKMTQAECASAMGVSRGTVAGIYENARFKIADAIINGKRLRITGGSYHIDSIPASSTISEKGENIMRIAVTYERELIGQHFGKTEQFKIYDIADGDIVSSKIIDTNGSGHGALAGFLRASEVEVLICGNIGAGARNALSEVGINLFPGVTGSVDEAVKSYLSGSLQYNPNTECSHHDHDHDHGEVHSCHHEDCDSHRHE